MKRYINSASGRTSVYFGEALDTYRKIANDISSYVPNEFYVNEQYGKIYHVNT